VRSRITSGLRARTPSLFPSETCFAMIPGTAAKAAPQPYEGMRGYA